MGLRKVGDLPTVEAWAGAVRKKERKKERTRLISQNARDLLV